VITRDKCQLAIENLAYLQRVALDGGIMKPDVFDSLMSFLREVQESLEDDSDARIHSRLRGARGR